MKKNFKWLAAVVVILSLSMTGCGTASNTEVQSGNSVKSVGTILLSVNPEIEIEYDENGDTLNLTGINEDGKNVVEKITDYKGKDCDDVVNDVVEEIYDGGYFDKKFEGRDKNIVIKLENGSKTPNKEFLDNLVKEVNTIVESKKLKSESMVVDKDDYNEEHQQDQYISEEKAKEIVLAQVGLKTAKFAEIDYDLDDGVYELEFTANGIEYDYEVDAVTGKIKKADFEKNDDWDKIPHQEENETSDLIGKNKAKNIALEHAGVKAEEANFTKVKLDTDNGVKEYEIDFYVGNVEYDYEINATNGTIISSEKEVDDDNKTQLTNNNSKTSSTLITKEKAKTIALNHAGVTANDAKFTKVKLETDDGVKEYEVDFYVGNVEYEYEINAKTGAVISSEKDIQDDVNDVLDD